MKRRSFLSSMALILPTALVSMDVLLPSCKNSDVEKEGFTEENIQLLNEIGETFIPVTADSPGAKAAKVGEFMKVYVTDCYSPDQQNIFWNGIKSLKKVSSKKYNKDFTKLSVAQKKSVLESFQDETANAKKVKEKEGTGDAIQTGRAQSSEATNNARFFPMIQNIVAFAYFTSEPGATKALRYIQTPGSYKGNVPYKKGEKSWAT